MKYKVSILVSDSYLKRKLELILSDIATFSDRESADVVFTSEKNASTRAVTVGRGEEYMLKIPFSDGDVLATLPKVGDTGRGLAVVDTRVILGEREIKFSELEKSLFMKLYDAKGQFVSREELFSVFAEGASESMLNVYIHYLREKLEGDGVRVIISSRKNGYKIDEKFFAREDL